MTRAGMSLSDLGGRLTGRSLSHFIELLPPDSETAKAERGDGGEYGMWADTSTLPMLVAELIDAVSHIDYVVQQVNSTRKLRVPEPIARPGVDAGTKGVRKYGSGAIPVGGFDAWWNGETEGER